MNMDKCGLAEMTLREIAIQYYALREDYGAPSEEHIFMDTAQEIEESEGKFIDAFRQIEDIDIQDDINSAGYRFASARRIAGMEEGIKTGARLMLSILGCEIPDLCMKE
jgi:hypothetical protein